MECLFQFQFRAKTYPAKAFFSYKEDPCYIFVYCKEKEIRTQFDEEIVIKTDFEKLLPKKDDHLPDLLSVRRAVFTALQDTNEFKQAKEERRKRIQA